MAGLFPAIAQIHFALSVVNTAVSHHTTNTPFKVLGLTAPNSTTLTT